MKLGDGSELNCRALLIATGVSYCQLKAKGIEQLNGAGVYYGTALGEGESVREQEVYIVGGANSAGQAAMYLSRFAKTVTMLVRGESLSSSMSQYLIDQIGTTDKIRVWTKSEVQEAVGSGRLEALVLTRGGGRTTETVPASALFIFIGAVPHTDWHGDLVACDQHGFILSGPDVPTKSAAAPLGLRDPKRRATPRRSSSRLAVRSPGPESPATNARFMLETSLPGVFVAGDVRHGSVKRVASAVGEGSMAVTYVHLYLNST